MSKKVWLVVILIIAINIFSKDIDTIETVLNSDTISDTLSVKQENSTIEPMKSNALSYYTIGCINDILLYPIPTTIYMFFNFFNIRLEKHNNALIYLFTYPIGLIFLEKFVTNMIVNKPNFSLKEPHSCISMNGQVGVITPASYSSETIVPHFDAKGFSKIAIDYEFQLNEKFSMSLCGERLGATSNFGGEYIYGFYGLALGAEFSSWKITLNKILFGYSYRYDDLKSYGYDFWGFGIEWSKRYYPYKGIFIEPNIAYRFSRTADYSVSIIGLFGGVNIGYRF